MPLYVADYLRDTRRLTAAEHGAYVLLIMEYWTSGELPDDDKQLARIACMSASEWRRARPNVQGFFYDGWKHKRIDAELARSAEISSKRSASAKQNHRNRSANADANAQQKDTHACASSQSPPPKDSEANASGADAPVDHRKRLFNEGLQKLAAMTGKGPDACRSFVGKCLKAASDDAIVVLGLIEEAERNQAVDPSAWIAARLKSRENSNGRRTVHDAANDLVQRIAALDGPAPGGLRGGEGEGAVRLLPPR
jgi:uncharacterized protein YdaU (DUF1376 family)